MPRLCALLVARTDPSGGGGRVDVSVATVLLRLIIPASLRFLLVLVKWPATAEAESDLASPSPAPSPMSVAVATAFPGAGAVPLQGFPSGPLGIVAGTGMGQRALLNTCKV